jgi:hypothetical protein
MIKFTNYAPFSFSSKEEIGIYFLISDCLSSVLKKKETKVLMEESVFKPLVQQVVSACKQFATMLKERVETKESPTSVKQGTMLAYLFDCLMKTLIMLVDGVMEDRE